MPAGEVTARPSRCDLHAMFQHDLPDGCGATANSSKAKFPMRPSFLWATETSSASVHDQDAVLFRDIQMAVRAVPRIAWPGAIGAKRPFGIKGLRHAPCPPQLPRVRRAHSKPENDHTAALDPGDPGDPGHGADLVQGLLGHEHGADAVAA
jgi:hypothetical protein